MRNLDYNKIILKIQNWIKNYINSAGAKGVVLGLSGGIDSAVTAALCVNTLGKNNVIALSLPIESLPKDIKDAKMFADQLGIRFQILDLTEVYKELLKTIPANFESKKMALSNIKPRMRMTMLYYTAQAQGECLVAGTGNRTEIAIGYFTKYGDGAVDFEPLGSLYKCEVREIAKLLDIPPEIINKPPSAGLWEGQTDEDEIGMTYEILDEIIYRIDHYLKLDDLDFEKVEKVIKMMKLAEHKNRMPPIFKIK